jgi:hypothetical protein
MVRQLVVCCAGVLLDVYGQVPPSAAVASTTQRSNTAVISRQRSRLLHARSRNTCPSASMQFSGRVHPEALGMVRAVTHVQNA